MTYFLHFENLNTNLKKDHQNISLLNSKLLFDVHISIYK